MEILNRPYNHLLVWQKADEFLKEIYFVSSLFPKEEIYNISSQLRRAALSCVLNIVEGHSRGSIKEFIRFLFIARASTTECAYLIDFCFHLKMISQDQHRKLEEKHRIMSLLIQKTMNGLFKIKKEDLKTTTS